ncbi:MAG: hypothetical protein JNG88_03380 [Phycisphaerales bacterium]|nr:hypothetical protein [Phycisphaerales bacterium]
MDFETMVRQLNPATARAFVQATRNVIDALMIEGARVREVQGPQSRDYEHAGLSRETPPGGWIASEELRSTAQRMNEAISLEKWTEGFIFAVRLMSMLGAA